MGKSRPPNLIIWWVGVVAQLFVLLSNSQNLEGQTLLEDNVHTVLPSSGVHLLQQNQHVVMTNGIVNVTLSVPDGMVTSITYNGSDNLLQTQNKEDNRGYWDLVWNKPGVPTIMDKLAGTSYKVVVQNKDQTEISFTTKWAVGSAKVPLNIDKRFHYMAMSDERQRDMPMPEDRMTGKVLDYPEAVLLTRPTNPHLKGEVDDKYLYSCDNKDNKVHGWVSNDPPLGFWMITPSNEFRTGGPFKQDLTSHVGPTVLSMQKEVASWPYNFPLSEDFLKSNQRGAVRGQLFVHDWYKNKKAVPAGASAYVGLAPPGGAGSWQLENKGYQFWTQTDSNGNFLIKNVIPGNYGLFAWVPGTIGDYKHASDINIAPGSNVVVRNVVFEAPRKGPTLWEIGIPDRTAAEYFIPDPSPSILIHPYPKPVEKFRQYGLWTRYKDFHPQADLIYTIGKSDYKKDLFFTHVTRNVGNNQYVATAWQILFDLKNVNKGANYTLQLALASANEAELQVRFNDPKSAPHFTTGLIGKDNAIARHGVHGLYHLYSIGISGSRLVDGNNTIFLTQTRSQGPFRGVMYDYIRLEGPA
ncbi:hypothetical protein DH2020_040375 [Rehmannia glutinosa]|uniref:rhamnogalacturonan endolyase n=1 Tax=Rehmannia glutinosa TaxID=99300 RepID=A0ABR0UUC2_REHGL